MFHNHGGHQVECDSQTLKDSKRSLRPELPTMAGSMEKFVVSASVWVHACVCVCVCVLTIFTSKSLHVFSLSFYGNETLVLINCWQHLKKGSAPWSYLITYLVLQIIIKNYFSSNWRLAFEYMTTMNE
jgi:hypothetical protein